MKSCPSCHQTYEDESMLFCLADGAKLLPATTVYVPQPTLVLPPPNATDPGPTVASPRSTVPPTVASPQPNVQPTMVAAPELVRVPPGAYSSAAPPERARSSAVPWILGILGIAIVLGLSGIVIALILTRNSGGTNQQIAQSATPTPSPARSDELTFDSRPSPTPEPKASPTATPAVPVKSPERPPKGTVQSPPGSVTVERPLPRETPPERPKPMFSVVDNMTLTGSRITYYPRPSFGTCQADCAGLASCKGFTWIRPGAYNPGDAAMCYLMSAVTGKVPHACCISAVRN